MGKTNCSVTLPAVNKYRQTLGLPKGYDPRMYLFRCPAKQFYLIVGIR
jgi:hypothetical protein